MAAFIDPGSDFTTIQTAQPGTRSVHHRLYEQKVYTFEEYKTLMRENLDDSKDKIRQQLKQHLKGKLQNVSDRIINELVTNILDPKRNVKLYSNHNHYSAVDYDDICREYKTRYNQIKEYNFLLIIAPTNSEYFDVHEDRKSRGKQYDRMFEDIKDRDSLVTVEVTTRAELETAIQQFIISTAKNALHAYIVFNGHGTSDGLVLNGEERCYRLDDFIRYTERCFDDSQDPFHLPARVLIVFGQCFGHLHDSSVNNSRFHVHSFTNPEFCETQFHVEVSETGDFDSTHFQLETFIDETMKLHRSRDVEMDKPSCLATARVPLLPRSISEYSSPLNSTSSEQMELSDVGISLLSSSASFSSDSRCDSSSVLADSGIENMEVDDSAFSDENRTKSMLSSFISRRQRKNP